MADNIVATGRIAQEAGLRLFLAVHYLNESYPEQREQLRRCIDASGRSIDAPSPLSEIWWSTQLAPLMVGAAQASLSPGVQGLIIDLERYNSGALAYGDEHGYDESAWAIIIQSIATHSPDLSSQGSNLPVEERRDWLIENGLLRYSHTQLELEVARRARGLLEAARAVNPNFEVHLYTPTLQTSWFYRGLYRGLGSPNRPVIVLSYDHGSQAIEAYLQSEGYSVLTLDGILGARLTADDLQIGLSNSASGSSGYWLYSLNDINGEGIAQDSPDDYWRVLQRLNQTLETEQTGMMP